MVTEILPVKVLWSYGDDTSCFQPTFRFIPPSSFYSCFFSHFFSLFLSIFSLYLSLLLFRPLSSSFFLSIPRSVSDMINHQSTNEFVPIFCQMTFPRLSLITTKWYKRSWRQHPWIQSLHRMISFKYLPLTFPLPGLVLGPLIPPLDIIMILAYMMSLELNLLPLIILLFRILVVVSYKLQSESLIILISNYSNHWLL